MWSNEEEGGSPLVLLFTCIMRQVANAAVYRTLYRQLLRLGRDLDSAPLGKALLLAQPAQLFDRRSRAVVKLPELSGWSLLLQHFNRGEFYAPHASVQEAIRDYRRSPLPVDDPVDVGLTAIKSLGLAVSGGEKLTELGFDCGTPSMVDKLTSVRAATSIRPGCLLLTHPVSCLKQPTLHHAVILIIACDDDGVTGVVINKPLDVTLGSAVAEEMHDKIGESLCASTVFRGGDVAERQLLLLHELPGLPDSTEVADGLYATNSFAEVREALDEHAAKEMEYAARLVAGGGGSKHTESMVRSRLAPRVKCVAGLAGWAREQLQAELERNVWFLVEADDVASLTMMEAEPAARKNAAGAPADSLRDAMWSGTMRQLGGEHEALARFPGDHELIFQHMELLWDDQNRLLHERIDMLGEPEAAGDDGGTSRG